MPVGGSPSEWQLAYFMTTVALNCVAHAAQLLQRILGGPGGEPVLPQSAQDTTAAGAAASAPCCIRCSACDRCRPSLLRWHAGM